MDLAERIETTRFLGVEFLLWLWFRSDILDAPRPLADLGAATLTFDTELTLTHWTDDSERMSLRGSSPADSPEAAEAVRQGKLPAKVALRLRLGEQEFVFVLEGRGLAVSRVKLPAVLAGEGQDEAFFERMRLLETLEAALLALYAEYLSLRASDNWSRKVVPAIRRWLDGEPSLTPKALAELMDAPAAPSPKARTRRR